MKNKLLLLAVLTSLVFASCKKEQKPVNLELKGFPTASRLIGPGLGTLGLIQDRMIYVHYLSSDLDWKLDRLSTFEIPEQAEGVIALGMGYIGVLEDNVMKMYFLDNDNEWKNFEGADFTIPSSYKRIFGVKMSYEMGMIALENNGKLFFYYLDEDLSWKLDETATFVIPEKTRQVFALGNMIVGLVMENDVVFAYLHPRENKWEIDYSFNVKMPRNFEAIIPIETDMFGMLRDGVVYLYAVDEQTGNWIYDARVKFPVAAFENPQ